MRTFHLRRMRIVLVLLTVLIGCAWNCEGNENEYETRIADQEKFQALFLADCMGAHDDFEGKNRCLRSERNRLHTNMYQPRSMENYTEVGFKKIKAPEDLLRIILDFWESNKNDIGERKKEEWPANKTSYSNHWSTPTYMIGIQDQALSGGGYKLKQQIWDATSSIIEKWVYSGAEKEDEELKLTPCSVQGIRVYKSGAIEAPHVNQLPIVISAIVNIDQDVDEPWPLEMIGHDGKVTHIILEKGDMVLYESHSIAHGYPYKLNGRFMANLFIHFEPKGHSFRYYRRKREQMLLLKQKKELRQDVVNGHPQTEGRLDTRNNENTDVDEQFVDHNDNASNTKKDESDHSSVSDDIGEDYVATNDGTDPVKEQEIPNDESRAETIELNQESEIETDTEISSPVEQESSESESISEKADEEESPGETLKYNREFHLAAHYGDLDFIKKYMHEADDARVVMDAPDENGWRPLHEASHAGRVEVVKYLLDNGAEINVGVRDGLGGTALWMARISGHTAAADALEYVGAISIEPSE